MPRYAPADERHDRTRDSPREKRHGGLNLVDPSIIVAQAQQDRAAHYDYTRNAHFYHTQIVTYADYYSIKS